MRLAQLWNRKHKHAGKEYVVSVQVKVVQVEIKKHSSGNA